MRLSISRKTFTLEDVPRTADLSDLHVIPGVSWRPRTATLRGPSAAAARLQQELARRGVRLADDEVRAAAAEALAESLDDGAEGLARFGDARAIPELSAALDGYAPGRECVICDYLAAAALAQAIELLGGSLGAEQRAKVDALRARQAGVWTPWPDTDPTDARVVDPALFEWARPPAAERVTARAGPRLGRNDPCHCGSGEKYKRCHLEEDRRIAASTRARH